jgi:hypothetical protein
MKHQSKVDVQLAGGRYTDVGSHWSEVPISMLKNIEIQSWSGKTFVCSVCTGMNALNYISLEQW